MPTLVFKIFAIAHLIFKGQHTNGTLAFAPIRSSRPERQKPKSHFLPTH
jgi:hypothetical protein